MKLSIVVPVYNSEKYLSRCIESLTLQTFRDIEIILVNDGSTDRSASICDEWSEKDARIITIHKQNEGVVSAWLKGIEKSAGDLIGFVDSDDYCDIDYFKTLADAQTKENADIVFGGYHIENDGKIGVGNYASAIIEPGIYEGAALENIKENIFEKSGTLLWARWLRVIKRDLLLSNLHLIDRRLFIGDDMSIALATLFDARKIVLTEATGYHYVQHSSSIMHNISATETENFDLLCANLENVCAIKQRKKYIYREFTAQMSVVIKKIIRSNIAHKNKVKLMSELRKSYYVGKIFKEKDYGKISFKNYICILLFRLKMFGLIARFK